MISKIVTSTSTIFRGSTSSFILDIWGSTKAGHRNNLSITTQLFHSSTIPSTNFSLLNLEKKVIFSCSHLIPVLSIYFICSPNRGSTHITRFECFAPCSKNSPEKETPTRPQPSEEVRRLSRFQWARSRNNLGTLQKMSYNNIVSKISSC